MILTPVLYTNKQARFRFFIDIVKLGHEFESINFLQAGYIERALLHLEEGNLVGATTIFEAIQDAKVVAIVNLASSKKLHAAGKPKIAE
jgi:hypothetical protein